ncbi:antiviral reverse transcriptase Drt3a [Sedimenticola hydrogenitrophicus]|uniref:antiviral reverse transcriptase Drt3a n=1 Tax=Sedimenticola hydrogenitrophicus TaxID=2967975 RepID=UPI0021A2C973
MFDQSFTSKNLARIYHDENKKGVNVAGIFFPEILAKYENIKRTRRLIRKLYINRRFYKKDTFEVRLAKLYEMMGHYKTIKNEAIESCVDEISRRINTKRFSFNIKKLPYKKNDKDVYVTNDDADSFFAEKQIQENIKYTYVVKQADRDLIVPQLRSILSDRFPKFIIKTDIESFYESIDRNLLIKKLNKNPILSLSTRKLIGKLLRDYDNLTGQDKGIPRGIGISAYLSELYLKDFDQKIRAIKNLTYYSRYVDDIIVVIAPKSAETVDDYFEKINSLIKSDLLSLKNNKSEWFTYTGIETGFSFDYLGYKFKKNGKNFDLSISDKKKEKYKKRIKLTFEKYAKHSVKQPRKAKKELFMRLKFLTTNTSLTNNKGNAIIGIYNTNKWVTDTKFLGGLDDFLRGQSNTIPDAIVKQKVMRFSFLDGFVNRTFCRFSLKELETIVKAWNR